MYFSCVRPQNTQKPVQNCSRMAIFFLQMFQCVARVRHFWFRNQFGNQNVKVKSVTFLVSKLICHSVIVAFWNNLLWQDDSTHITHNVILGKNLRKRRKWFLWLMMRSSLFLSFVPNPPQSVHHIINNLEQRQKNESNKLFLVRLSRSMFNCSIQTASCTKINSNLLTFPDVV